MTDLPLYRRIPVSPRAARFGTAAPAGEVGRPPASPAEYSVIPLTFFVAAWLGCPPALAIHGRGDMALAVFVIGCLFVAGLGIVELRRILGLLTDAEKRERGGE